MKRKNSLHHTSLTEKKALLEHMRARAADFEEQARGHVDQGRSERALALLADAAELRRLAATRGRTGLPKRTYSWQVER